MPRVSHPVTGGIEQTIFWVNQILRFGKFLAVFQPMPNDPNKTVVTAYVALAIKGDVLDRKAEYARVPVLKNLLPAQVLMGNSTFNTGNSISAGAPVPPPHRRNRLRVDRRAPGDEALAEAAHPEVVLVELLPPCQRAPRNQLVDVGVAGVVADLLALEPGPGGGGDDLARLGLHVAVADLLVFLGDGQVGVLAARELAERLPGLHRHLAIRLRREAEDGLDGVEVVGVE